MKKYTYIIALFLFFGCSQSIKNPKEHKTEKKNKLSKNAKLTIFDSLQITDSKIPFKIWSYRIGKDKLLSEKGFKSLKLNNVFNSYHSNFEYKIFSEVNFSSKFKTIIISTYDKKRFNSMYLITYDSNNDIIDSILVYQMNNEINKLYLSTYIVDNHIYIDNMELNTTLEYNLNMNGKFKKNKRPVTFKHYRYLGKFKGRVNDMPKGNVNSKNGIVIKDSLHRQIRKIGFGETVYILGYSKDKKIAKIVINTDSVKTGKDFYITKSNITSVDTNKLFKPYSSHDEIESLYSYAYLKIGEKGNEAQIDLKDLFDIKKIDLAKYKNKIITKSSTVISLLPKKINGKIELVFENGNVLVLKDTTYNSEYKPTRSYEVSFHPDFKNSYLVSESMFFTNDIYSVISKKNGDTLHQFSGYPNISPKGLYSVSVYADWTECDQETTLDIKHRINNKYHSFTNISVNSWSYPFKLNSSGMQIDDFSIYWLSDNEFIIKVKNYEECRLGEKIEGFYLKYRIK